MCVFWIPLPLPLPRNACDIGSCCGKTPVIVARDPLGVPIGLSYVL